MFFSVGDAKAAFAPYPNDDLVVVVLVPNLRIYFPLSGLQNQHFISAQGNLDQISILFEIVGNTIRVDI
jgi:hypothetical protein